ncbi:hypothetical protein [Promicromonospora kroppenstedtii]|uniref:hypothetical protein n=1 Tax=Promicromonospora kroppenstedtii TaxID=440482 RepID=UPI000565C9FE|nr:hypothetical protein [Promicromonospora kroppenstedtii]
MTTITTPNGQTHPVDLVLTLDVGRDSRTIITQPPSGNPYISRRPATTKSGSATLLVRDYATARAIVDGFATAGPATLAVREGREVHTNFVTDPRAMQAPPWTSVPGTGGVTSELMVTGASDGPVLPDGTMVTTYARYTFTTASTGGASSFGYAIPGVDLGLWPTGTDLAGSIYVRTSIAVASGRANVAWQAPAPSFADTGANGAASPTAPGVWQRVGHVATTTSPAGNFGCRYFATSQVWPLGATVDVTCALAVPDAAALPGHFDGAYAPPGFTSSWDGAVNASTSTAVSTGGVTETLVFELAGRAQLASDRARKWTVQVPFALAS